MVQIANDYLTILINEKGAELTSIKHLKWGTEYLWQAGLQWSNHSPILFPIVGSLKDGTYKYKDKVFPLSRHGFARDKTFELIEQTSDSAIFQLVADEDALLVYPFKFKLQIHYTLAIDTLKVGYKVINDGEDFMFFSIGGHPAFNVPLEDGLQFNDYQLLFAFSEQQKFPIKIFPLSEVGLTKTEGYSYFFQLNHSMQLDAALFKEDALVFKNLEDYTVSLVAPNGKRSLHLKSVGFPFLGIWNTYGAPFVCIEPWNGITDQVEASGILEEKEGIITLAPKATWSAGWELQLK